MCLVNLKINQSSYYNLPNSAFGGGLSTESQPQNPEFRINPENFHRCIPFSSRLGDLYIFIKTENKSEAIVICLIQFF